MLPAAAAAVDAAVSQWSTVVNVNNDREQPDRPTEREREREGTTESISTGLDDD